LIKSDNATSTAGSDTEAGTATLLAGQILC
jgi:hypothetical protein